MNAPAGAKEAVTSLTERILGDAARLGFAAAGIAPLTTPHRFAAYQEWLADGFAGSMDYLASADHIGPRREPTRLLPGARTAIVVAAAYPPPQQRPVTATAAAGAIAAYACGDDYHPVLKTRLDRLAAAIADAVGRPIRHRACVDSAPLLERELGVRAGLGFIGKNTMLIVPGTGSYVLLGELLVDVELPSPSPARRPSCGSCRACLDACPTGALVAPYRLDARRCISYLTIEHHQTIPRSLRPGLGAAVFGCDLCQQACPYNRAAARAESLPELVGDPTRKAPDLLSLLELGSNQLRNFRRRNALRRVSRPVLLRSLCVALGNLGDDRATPALTRRLEDSSALVRGHAGWALARLGHGDRCRAALARETDPDTAAELARAVSDAAR